ncbi:MAG: hypothetical protein IIC31_05415 [Chloroflexi bacterium]|nr:hypothetical protein [Chloroflexota bacterium]
MVDTPSDPASQLLRMTDTVTSEELAWMVLEHAQLPAEFSSFELLREERLDNETMAKHTGGRHTTASLGELGRSSGYARAFAVPQGAPTLREEPADILEAATVVHLFEQPKDVDRWIDDVFVAGFKDRVGGEEPDGSRLLGVESLKVSGFHEHAAALLVVHEAPEGSVLASTIVDFRLGRLLGVAYVVAKRDASFIELATELGAELERQMVRIVLGS